MDNLKNVNGGVSNSETKIFNIGDSVYVSDNAYDINSRKEIKGGNGVIVSKKPHGLDFRNYYDYGIEIKRESGNIETVLVAQKHVNKI